MDGTSKLIHRLVTAGPGVSEEEFLRTMQECLTEMISTLPRIESDVDAGISSQETALSH